MEKETALTELRKRCKEENTCLRNEERAFRSHLKKINESEKHTMPHSSRSQCPPDDRASQQRRKVLKGQAETSIHEIQHQMTLLQAHITDQTQRVHELTEAIFSARVIRKQTT
jgi:hypothetical protein